MRTERLALAAAAAVALEILWLGPLPGPLAAAFSVLAYASLTLLLWIAARGRRPLAVPAGVMLLGAFALNPAPAVAAAGLTAVALFFLQGKLACAESSPR